MPIDTPTYDNPMYIQMLKDILERITLLEDMVKAALVSSHENEATEKTPAVLWTASKTDLIELVYALYAARVFNNGRVRIKDIAILFEMAFGLQLGNTSLRFQEILRRKESTAFISELKHGLELYIIKVDEKGLR